MDAEEETCENDYNDDIGEPACGLWQRWQQRPGPRRVDPCSRCTVYALPSVFLAMISLFTVYKQSEWALLEYFSDLSSLLDCRAFTLLSLRWKRPGLRVDPCSRCSVYALPLSFLAIISLFAKFWLVARTCKKFSFDNQRGIRSSR